MSLSVNILVIGSGGREHALVWKLAQSPKVKKIFCAPGNGGIGAQAACIDIPTTDVKACLSFAKENKIDLTLVGPESPLAKGVVNAFNEEGLKIFGPTREAARLESSKVFTKEFCERHHLPQAPYAIFDNTNLAKDYVHQQTFPLVVKADGLAQGKGAIVCKSEEEACRAIEKMLVEKHFGEAGSQIVIEGFLKGEEASFIAVVDGEHVLPLASAKDHKRLLDGDGGPNTGGMGAFSPSPLITPSVYEKIMERIMFPTVRGMATEGFPFIGFLYAGLMIDDGSPKLLEFNVRMGDPETQVILPRLKTDWVDILEAALNGRVDAITPSWETTACACVVIVSQGYPEEYETGLPIQGLKEAEKMSKVLVFHAGTKREKETLVTAGGRVLGICALDRDVPRACKRVYEAAQKISWKGCYYRRDIGLVR